MPKRPRVRRELLFRARWGPILTLVFGALGLLFLLGGPAALYLLWYRLGRDKPVEMVADYLPEPPDDLAPGVVGTLLDEQADMQDIIATLVDLAQRKVISITEEKTGQFQVARDFIYRYENRKLPVSSFEQLLLDSLFDLRDEVRLSDLKDKFHRELPALKRALYSEVTDQGFFARSPEKVRNQYGCLGVCLLVLAGLAGLGLWTLFSGLTGAAVLPGIGLAATAFGFLLLSRFMPRKTDLGSELAARWQAFKRYLRDIDRYSDLEEQKELWDRWLPYAIAFGVDSQYIRKFEAVDAPAPGWYIPDPTMYGPYRRWYYGPGPVGRPLRPAGGGGPAGGETPGMPSGSPAGGGLGGGLGDVSRGLGSSLDRHERRPRRAAHQHQRHHDQPPQQLLHSHRRLEQWRLEWRGLLRRRLRRWWGRRWRRRFRIKNDPRRTQRKHEERQKRKREGGQRQTRKIGSFALTPGNSKNIDPRRTRRNAENCNGKKREASNRQRQRRR